MKMYLNVANLSRIRSLLSLTGCFAITLLFIARIRGISKLFVFVSRHKYDRPTSCVTLMLYKVSIDDYRVEVCRLSLYANLTKDSDTRRICITGCLNCLVQQNKRFSRSSLPSTKTKFSCVSTRGFENDLT